MTFLSEKKGIEVLRESVIFFKSQLIWQPNLPPRVGEPWYILICIWISPVGYVVMAMTTNLMKEFHSTFHSEVSSTRWDASVCVSSDSKYSSRSTRVSCCILMDVSDTFRNHSGRTNRGKEKKRQNSEFSRGGTTNGVMCRIKCWLFQPRHSQKSPWDRGATQMAVPLRTHCSHLENK